MIVIMEKDDYFCEQSAPLNQRFLAYSLIGRGSAGFFTFLFSFRMFLLAALDWGAEEEQRYDLFTDNPSKALFMAVAGTAWVLAKVACILDLCAFRARERLTLVDFLLVNLVEQVFWSTILGLAIWYLRDRFIWATAIIAMTTQVPGPLSFFFLLFFSYFPPFLLRVSMAQPLVYILTNQISIVFSLLVVSYTVS